MNSVKTLFLAVLLSAAAYGVYVTVTGAPPGNPPKEAAKDWDKGPQVELPATLGPADPASMPPAGGGPPPKFVSTAPPEANPLEPAASDGGPPYDPSATSSGSGSAPPFVPHDVGPTGDAAPPLYPKTATPDSPLEVPQDNAPRADAGRYPAEVPVRYDVPGTVYAPDAHADYSAARQAAQALLDQGRLDDALVELSRWSDDPRLSDSDRAELVELLDQLAGTVVYSREHLLEAAYVVQPGDTLERIADAYQVPWQLLAKINGIQDPQRLQPRELLKVVRGPFDAVVDLERYQLTLFLHGRYAGRFRIGVGEDRSTPDGEFVVQEKIHNPTYYGRDRVVDADDPDNPLGERWISLGNQLGIHGTHDPQSIGRAESRGCIRLAPTDIEDLFDILSAESQYSVGSKVVIRR